MKNIFLLLCLSASVASASVNSNTTTVDTSTKRSDVDAEITNPRLRAMTGGKSLLSIQTSFTYNGGSISSPFANERPRLTPGTVEIDPSKLTGNLSMKYRATDRDNINLGFGIGWLTPFSTGQAFQAENPFLSYGRTFRLGTIQNVTNASLKKYTAYTATKRGLNFESTLEHTFLVPLGKSGFQWGLILGWYRQFYDRTVNDNQDKFGAFTSIEYLINSKLSVRTSYRGFVYYNYTKELASYRRDEPTQSLGMGWAVARDIFLFPNVQWVWADIRPEKTNVALTAYVNL